MDTVDRIFLLVDKMYSEQREFAADLGIPASRVSEWRRKKSTSYNKRLPQIAIVLGTTVEYLVTGENKTPAGQDADGREKEFIQLFGKLTPEQQDLVIAQLRGVVNSQDK